MRAASLLLVVGLVLTGCVSNQGLKPTYEPSTRPQPPVPTAPPAFPPSMPRKNIDMRRVASMVTLSPTKVHTSAGQPTTQSYAPLTSSNFLTLRVEGTNVVLAWPTNAWLAGAVPLWRTNIVSTNEVWKAVPTVQAHTNSNWRTTNAAMFEYRAPIRHNETRFFTLGTNFSVNIAWNFPANEAVTGFKLYVGPSPRTYTVSTSYTHQATWEGGTNFSAWVQGLPTTTTLYLTATAYLTDVSGDLESDFSEELVIPPQR